MGRSLLLAPSGVISNAISGFSAMWSQIDDDHALTGCGKSLDLEKTDMKQALLRNSDHVKSMGTDMPQPVIGSETTISRLFPHPARRPKLGYSRARCRMPRLVGTAITAMFVMVACNVLSSCSPYVYSSDVAKLSTETSSIDASSQQTASAIASQQYQNRRYQWIQEKVALAAGPGCSLHYTGPVACELVSGSSASVLPLTDEAKTASTTRSADVCAMADTATPVNPTSSQAGGQEGPIRQLATKKNPTTPVEIADLLKALDNYTAALAAVTKAQDRTDFDTAAGKLSAAVGTLAQSGGPYGAAAAPIAKASVNIALWVVGEALDYQRLEALRNSTRAACQPIHIITDALGVALDIQRRSLLQLDSDWLKIDMLRKYDMDRANPRVNDAALGTDIDNAQAAVVKFEAVRVSNPIATMRALSDAHDALVLAVRNNDGEFGTLIANLQTLAQYAQALAAAAAPAAKKS